MKQLAWSWFDHRTDVPHWVASGIGRVVIEWSVLERELEELIQLLLDTDIQPARILTNKMNARTRVFAATNLLQAHVYNQKLPVAKLRDFTRLRKHIEALETSKRDVLAHGLWSKIKGKWHVLKLRQSRKTPELIPDLQTLSRAVVPQREIVTKAKLRSIAMEIVTAANDVQAFREALEGALSPSRYTRLKYSRRRYRYRWQRIGIAY
jgi:hypothetical protein